MRDPDKYNDRFTVGMIFGAFVALFIAVVIFAWFL